ncbi:DUF2637 domain-containing protein [Actinoplanes sp. TRM 88003]|uniref:DUF2637 domain-containing protein n=1 Tax=Paractinoplanes aksuensis TaxID=2939490 RepID=A0ABT1DPP9_9ACTN|nr:DUF2637 domain-containing protein [Actinoplanes aksuensis]MCO8272821.1 DUF2637 domain-containing protein [Actinoplanes aksuensis]
MTAPTLTRSAYPASIDELMPKAIELTRTLDGELPSRNRLMKELRIGSEKAKTVLSELGKLAERDQNVKDLHTSMVIRGSVAPRPPLHLVPETLPAEAEPLPEPGPVAEAELLAEPAPVVEADRAPVPAAEDAVTPGTSVSRLKRIGWAVRAVFTLGIAASLAGNVLHASDNIISQAISAWSPLALLLTVELISRVPVRRGPTSYLRLAATAVIAGIAAWVSYWHMVGVAVEYGETGASAYLLPFSVDGLIVVASISLVEIGGRIRALIERQP